MLRGLALSALPGLYVFGFAFALRWALERWYGRLPLWVLAAFLAMVSVVFAPSLFGGRVQLPLHLLTSSPPYEDIRPPEAPSNWVQGDLIHEVAPHELTARRLLARGEWPLWNASVGAGMPLLADPQAHTHWLQPITAPALVLPVAQRFAAVAASRVFVALVFTFLVLGTLGLAEGPAFFGAVAFGFGAFVQIWVGWPIANAAAALPLAAYAVILAAERGAVRDWVLLIIATVVVLLVGHPETTLYVGLVMAVVALGFVFRDGERPKWRLFGGYAGAVVVAGCLVAPALLPSVEYLPQTHRYHLLENRNERLGELDPLRGWRHPDQAWESLGDLAGRLVPTVAPLALGSDLLGQYWGEASTYLYGAAFVGTLTLVLGLAAYRPRAARFPFERGLLWIGVPITGLVLARPPGLRELFAAVPLMDRSPSDHARVVLLLGFFLAVLASMTLDRWCRAEGSGLPTTLVAAGVGLALIAASFLFAPDQPNRIMSVRRLALFGQLGLLLAGGLLLARFRGPREKARVALPIALSLMTFVELALFFAPANPTSPPGLFYPETAATRFLAQGDGEDRVVGLGDVLPPNIPSVYGLSDPRISNASKPWEYALLVSPLLHSVRDMTDVFELAVHPLYRLLGVRYVAIRDQFSLSPLRRAFLGDGLAVYESPEPPLPRLFLPRTARRFGSARLRDLASVDDFGRTSFADSIPRAVSSDPGHWKSAEGGGSRLAIEDGAASATHLAARADLGEPRLVASSVYQDGNWHLLADGRRLDSVRTNWVFAGAWLDRGDHRLDLVYRPASFVWGAVLAALGLVTALVWLLPCPRGADRGRGEGQGPGLV